MRVPFSEVIDRSIPNGPIRVRCKFSGLETAIYDANVRNGCVVLQFPVGAGDSVTHEPMILSASGMRAADSPSFDYEVRDELFNPLMTLRSHQGLLQNLKRIRVVRSTAGYGLALNDEILVLPGKEQEWRNFPNFLIDYFEKKVGASWLRREASRRDGHPLAKIFRTFQLQLNRALFESPSIRVLHCGNGVVAWMLDFAYSLFCIAQNERLQELILNRLRHPDQFWGAAHECFVSALFSRAGFKLDLEDERDGTRRHPEFIATFRKNGESISVEAKSIYRRQLAELRFADWRIDRMKLLKVISRGARKCGSHPHIVVVDLAVPPLNTTQQQVVFNDYINSKLLKMCRHNNGNLDSWNAIYLISRPYLFTEGTDIEAVASSYSVFSGSPRIAHPSAELYASVNEAMRTLRGTRDEIEAITRYLQSESSRHRQKLLLPPTAIDLSRA